MARRAAAREVQPAAGAPEPETDDGPRGSGLERHEEVERLLSRLPAREREVVRLHYIEGRTYEEIATELNIPVNSIGPILSRARKKLRQGAHGTPPVVKPGDVKPRE